MAVLISLLLVSITGPGFACDLDAMAEDPAIYADRIGRCLASQEPIRDLMLLGLAIVYGDVGGVEAALAAGADPNAVAEKPLHGEELGMQGLSMLGRAILADEGSGAVVRLLLEAGFDPAADAYVHEPGPALHFAARHRSIPAIRALVEAGVDPNMTNTTGETALGLSTSLRGDDVPDVASALLAAGADPDGGNARPSRPLIKAASG